MKIVYLISAAEDINWFRHYYKIIFPDGSKKVYRQIKVSEEMLLANPYIGHASDINKSIRELHIPKTPFTLIYRVTDTQIEILRLWDERQSDI